MKILFLTVNLSGGGAEKVLVNLANELSKRGHDITVRSLVNYGINKNYLKNTVKYEYIFKYNLPGIGRLYYLPKKFIYNLVAHGEYDIVIPYLQGVLTRIVANAPIQQKKIAWLHADMGTSLSLFRKDELADIWGKYSHIVAVSETAQKSFETLSGIKGRTSVLYNTFDVIGIRAKSLECYSDKFTDSCIRLCSVGKLQQVKGYLRLVKVMKKLRDDGINCVLTIVGEGEQRSDIEKAISDYGLNDYVTLAGFDSNPYKYIANSDLFVCSSYSEGFSSVVAESLILGVPVLTTDCAGMREMLGDNGEYGIIVENTDEALYKGLTELVIPVNRLSEYKEKAKLRSAFFEPEQTVGAVEKMLEEVINE